MKQLYIKYLFLFFYINLPTFIDEEPIKDQLKLDEENEIYFPIQIKGVSISFIQGLIKDLVNKYGKEKVLQLITLKSDNEMLQERLNRNIKF